MPQLGRNAKAVFDVALRGEALIIVSSIVLAELFYTNRKQKLPLNFPDTYTALRTASQFVFVDFCPEDALQFDDLLAIPEMHDRMIAGVAVARKCPCLTCDGSIVASNLVPVVW